MANSPASKAFKQRLRRLHTVVGLPCALLFYVILFFGILAIFKPYITVWEKPSRHLAIQETGSIDYAKMVDTLLADPDFPRNKIEIQLPGADPTVRIRHAFTERFVFDPSATQRNIDESHKSTFLAFFFKKMHYDALLKQPGRIVYGLGSVAILALIIVGIIQVARMRYPKTDTKPITFFSLWHRRPLLWLSPALLLLVWHGAILNLALISIPPMFSMVADDEKSDFIEVMTPIVRTPAHLVKRDGRSAEMVPIGELMEKAQQLSPDITFTRAYLYHWGDANAQLELRGINPFRPFTHGTSYFPTIILQGVDGSVVKQTEVFDAPWYRVCLDALAFLHLLPDQGAGVRLAVALFLAGGTLGLAYGIFLWLEKQSRAFAREIPFYHWLSKLSLAVTIGVFPATAVAFNLQWLLPMDMDDRIFYQQATFVNVWLATLTWAFFRLNSFTAARELLGIGGLLFLAAPVVHWLASGFSPFAMWQLNMDTILGVDIALILLGALLICTACLLPENKKELPRFFKLQLNKEISA